MTEAELVESWVSLHGVAVSSLMYFMTIVSGYLVLAFFVGKELNRNQVVFVSALFTVFTLTSLWSTNGHLYVADQYRLRLEDDVRLLGSLKNYHLVFPMQFLAIIGCLKFMWDIRHPKSE